jgi:hypothetical protein
MPAAAAAISKLPQLQCFSTAVDRCVTTTLSGSYGPLRVQNSLLSALKESLQLTRLSIYISLEGNQLEQLSAFSSLKHLSLT